MLHHIIDFAGMHHQIDQTSTFMIVHFVTAKEIECETIRHNPFRTHRGTLIVIVETFVERIVFSHILIEADSQQCIYQNDRFIECGYLRINKWYFRIGDFLLQLPESFGEPFFYFVKIGIFSFDIAQQAKQGGIRVEFLQTLRNGIVLHRTDRQYIFYQNLCRLAIVHCQFLHSGKAVGANIFAQQLIVSQNRNPFFLLLRNCSCA